MIRVAVFASGKGSNFEAIADYFKKSKDVNISLLVCDQPKARVIEIAEKLDIEYVVFTSEKYKTRLSESEEKKLLELLRLKNIDLIVLAGYMRILKSTILSAYSKRVLNIHPSLLPAHKGLDPVRKAIDAGDAYAGCTVHMVTEEIDAGEILGQSKVIIKADDKEEDLFRRIHQAEHKLYPKVIAEIAGKLK